VHQAARAERLYVRLYRETVGSWPSGPPRRHAVGDVSGVSPGGTSGTSTLARGRAAAFARAVATL